MKQGQRTANSFSQASQKTYERQQQNVSLLQKCTWEFWVTPNNRRAAHRNILRGRERERGERVIEVNISLHSDHDKISLDVNYCYPVNFNSHNVLSYNH